MQVYGVPLVHQVMTTCVPAPLLLWTGVHNSGTDMWEEAPWEGGFCVLGGIDSGCPWPHLRLLMNIDNLFWTLIAAPAHVGRHLCFLGAGKLPSHC